MCAKKSEALQSKIEDVKSEAIDDISRTMKENNVPIYHEFPTPLRYQGKFITGIKDDPHSEEGPFVEYTEFEIEKDEELEELELDLILFILYNLEDEYKVS